MFWLFNEKLNAYLAPRAPAGYVNGAAVDDVPGDRRENKKDFIPISRHDH